MRVIPSRPGEPWAPPQAAEVSARPDLLAPPSDDLEHLISDRIEPVDPTVREPVLASAPYLETPEGMLRIRKPGEVDRFVHPCHLEGWLKLEWQAVLPISTDAVGDGGTDPTDPTDPVDPPDPGPVLPVIVELNPEEPLEVRGKPVNVSVVGTGIEATGDLLVNGALQSADSNYTYTSDTECSFIFDSSAIRRPIKLPVILVNSAGQSDPAMLEVLPTQDDPAPVDSKIEGEPEPEPYFSGFTAMTRDEMTSHCLEVYGVALDQSMTKKEMVAEAERLEQEAEAKLEGKPEAKPVDFASMTKAEITDHCLQDFGIHLDQSMTKAEMLSEAERLQLEVATMPDPPAGDGLGDVPSDLLG